MKIIKRDGRIVEYDSDKIRVAIGKANAEVLENDKITDEDIDLIIKYIEDLGKKRMLVEDIQDIIEEKLMERGKYHLAKIYIIYRYKRSIIRKSNTIDASILSLLKNADYVEGNYLSANRQRDVMAGEVSKDLAYRLLLPKNVVDAEQEGKIEFANVEYFTEPIIESSLIDLAHMLERGTVINGVKIESPKSFQSACNILVEIVASVASGQTGNIYINMKDLFKYYYLTYDKMYDMFFTLMKDSLSEEQIKAITHTQAMLEVRTGIQTILYQINTITIGSGLVPKVNFIIDVRDIGSLEEEQIIAEFIKQKSEGIKNADGLYFAPAFPCIVYIVPQDEVVFDKYDYITRELVDSDVDYEIMSEKRGEVFLKNLKKFTQGSMIINLAKIAIEAKEQNLDFCDLLKENLSYCYEGFLCRNHNLQGIYGGISPIHWCHGAIAELGLNERIDQYLKKGYSIMSLVVCGFEAGLKFLDGDDSLKKRIVSIINDTVREWNHDNSFEVEISNDYLRFDKTKLFNQTYYESYGIKTLADSLEFISSNYFKEGSIVGYVHGEADILEIVLNNPNLIIEKKSAI